MEQFKSWEEMRRWCEDLLIRATGENVAQWNAKIAGREFADQDALRAWLTGEGVTGYARMLLVMERFGYPDFMLASADELIDGQYRDRPALRPLLDAVIAAVQTFGPVNLQARKTYVSLLTPKRTFAIVQPTTRQRVDVGLRLDGAPAGGRLLTAGSLGNETINLRLPLTRVEELDDEALTILERAYRANCPEGEA